MKIVARISVAVAMAVSAACVLPPPPPAAMPPTPPPPPPPVMPPPPAPEPPRIYDVNVCAVLEDGPVELRLSYNSATGDTTVNGRPVAEALPPAAAYAGSAPWYVNAEPIVLDGVTMVKYGLPRVVGVGELRRAGEFRGVGVYVPADGSSDRRGRPELAYVPVRAGCEFQAYQSAGSAAEVRGG
jgi:hypothetical protein